MHDNLPDEELLRVYRHTGTMEVVGRLFVRYSALVFGVCLKYLKNREEARDASMHLFEKLPKLLLHHDIQYFKGWLYTTVRNHCLMTLRSRKNHIVNDLPDFVVETVPEVHQDNVLDEARMEALEHCLSRLAEGQQQCVRLFYLQQKCYAEVAAITGFSLKAVKSYIQNGRRNLKICIEKHAQLHR
jgi:RNA polymerase sigma-70 factor (ECF subfamily)